MSIRVLIADDDALIREALEILLSRDPELEVVAAVADGLSAVEYCQSHSVDVALLDIRMPVLDGLAATARLRAQNRCRVLLFSTFAEPALARAAVAGGASGYLLKGCSSTELREAIRLVAQGHTVFREEVVTAAASPRAPDALEALSERERELVRLIAQGYSNREAAEAMLLSEGTVKNYVSSILDKLGLRQRTQIAIYYLGGQTPG